MEWVSVKGAVEESLVLSVRGPFVHLRSFQFVRPSSIERARDCALLPSRETASLGRCAGGRDHMSHVARRRLSLTTSQVSAMGCGLDWKDDGGTCC